MIEENPNQQSTTGKITSGFLKTTGYTNVFGIITGFIIGGLMVLGGIALALLFSNFFPLVFSGVGLLIILLGFWGLKSSKRMRKGKYYHVGKGWVKPK